MNLSIVHYANTVSIDREVIVMGKKANKNIKGEYKKPDFYNSDQVNYENFGEILLESFELFPYPVHIYDPEGNLMETNTAFLKLFNIPSKVDLIGQYNVLKDPLIKEWGLYDYVRRSFNGEKVYLTDVKTPVRSISDTYKRELDFNSLYQKIISFPIIKEGQLLCVITVFITASTYAGNESIISAKQYIDANWKEPLSISDLCSHVNLSKTHLYRLFKDFTGLTPHEYYIGVKIEHIKELLKDQSYSVSMCFEQCGLSYSGYYSGIFREKTGMSPSLYRKKNSTFTT